MKKLILVAFVAIFSIGTTLGQGLEGIVIDTFYIGDAADADVSLDDPLPSVGTAVYRVYVDMLPGYDFVSLYGQTEPASGKIDTLKISTTTSWFNNEDRGESFGYLIGENRLDEGTVMVDSYLSTGGSSDGTLAVLKSEDTDGAITNGDGLLQNNDPLAGVAISVTDGNIPGTPVTFTLPPGFGSVVDASFADDNGVSLETFEGAVALTVPLQGPTAANRVMIGQFTTDGDFSFQLNLSIRNTSTGIAEEYVAKTPQTGQFTHQDLIFPFVNDAPTVSITDPNDGDTYTEGDPALTVTATAADTDGTISQVEFFDGTTSLGVDTDGTDGYSVSFTPNGPATLTAVATDDAGESTTSDVVNLNYVGNAAPVVTLNSIPNTITGDDVTISATATDDVAVAQVEFTVDGTSIGVDTDGTDGYSVVYTTTTAGSFNVVATATDSGSATTKTGTDSGTLTVADNQAPTATVSAPPAGGNYNDGAMVTIEASGNDVDGTVASMEFFVNGTSVGSANAAPFTFDYTLDFATTGASVSITAVATDDRGLAGAASAAVVINILDPSGSPYAMDDLTQDCNIDDICMPFGVRKDINNIIGWDLVLTWDNSKIYPTGIITKLSDVLDPTLFETDHYIDFANNQMLISIFFNSSAPIGTFFEWDDATAPDDFGDIICIDFEKRPGFTSTETTDVTVTSLEESYVNGVVPVLASIDAGTLTSTRTEEFTGSLQFWADFSPIVYKAGENLISTITGNNESCSSLAATSVTVDSAGFFTHDLNNGLSITIDRDIANSTDVQPVINGFDALQVRKMILNLLEVPNVYQIIAMDVNMDGRISAGDASQINQRAVTQIGEYRQAWSHDVDGNKITADPTKDWLWLSEAVLESDPQYLVSTNFPEDNGVGYSRYRVPTLPFCMPAPVEDWATCPIVTTDNYTGILLGDINGNYKSLDNDVLLRSTERLVLGLGDAVANENFIDVPVTFDSDEDVFALDLAVEFDQDLLKFNNVISASSDLQVTSFFNEKDRTLRITSNSLSALNSDKEAFVIRFDLLDSMIDAEDFMNGRGYINGDDVVFDVVAESVLAVGDVEGFDFMAYPNPTSGILNISVAVDAVADVFDMQGRRMISSQIMNANSDNQIDISELPNGIYTINLYNNEGMVSERVILTK